MGKVSYLPAARLDDVLHRGRSRIIRYCFELREDPKILLKNLEAADVKAFFDWIEKNFKDSIKADSSLSEYWRVLKRLYVQENGQCMDKTMSTDIVNVRGRPNPW